MNKITISKLKKWKSNKKITMITAYDSLFAKLFDEYVDMILVGDSLNMSFYGADDTVSATMEQMLYHTKAVCNGAKKAYIVADMPFGSYATKELALKNSIKFFKETKADAVKLEGGKEKAEIIKLLSDNAIAVVAHIGLMPQYSRSEGGYKVKGRDIESEEYLIQSAIELEKAGAVAIVIEGVLEEVSKKITESVSIPTIGIGAGKVTDGQVLVWSDMLGFFEEFKPKFVKQYFNGATQIRESVQKYVNEVETGKFPTENEIYK